MLFICNSMCERAVVISMAEFYTVKELMKILPLGRNSIYKIVSREDFPKVMVGRKILIPVDQFKDYMIGHLGMAID